MVVRVMNEDLELTCPQVELSILGSFFKNPPTFFSYMDVVKNSDFGDGNGRFWHVFIDKYLLTYSNEVTPALLNTFASMDTTRMQGYRRYGGYNTVKAMMEIALDEESLMNAVNTLKKYSLLRSLHKDGYPVENIVGHNRFSQMTAEDVAGLVRGKLDSICNSAIVNLDAPDDMAKNTFGFVNDFFEAPSHGIGTPWRFLNEFCLGLHPGDSLASLAISNSGKGRNLIYLATYLAFVEGAKVYLCSNEMSLDKQKRAVLTTACNAPYMKKLTGTNLVIPEKRLVLASYLSDWDKQIIHRNIDKDGNFTESIEDFRARVYKESTEYQQVCEVARYLENNMKDKFLFKDVTGNYSDESMVRLFSQAVLCSGADVVCYDTLKPPPSSGGGKIGDWATFQQTATKLQECIQKLKTASGIFTTQADRSSVHKRIEQLTQDSFSMNSSLFHLLDECMGWLHIKPEDYKDYAILQYNKHYGEVVECELSPNKKYVGARLLKNRRGNKGHLFVMEVDLDTNVWEQIDGELIVKNSKPDTWGKK